MRLTFAATVACALLLFPTSSYAADEAPLCDAIELGGAPTYDEWVCDGIAAMERKDFAQAIRLFEQAMEVPLFEWPNYMLFPRLALVYHYAGQRQKARETLEKAELRSRLSRGSWTVSKCPISLTLRTTAIGSSGVGISIGIRLNRLIMTKSPTACVVSFIHGQNP